MNIFKKIHITHCFILYVIIFFLSIFALLKVFRYNWADTLYNGYFVTTDSEPLILREDVEVMNKKLKDVFPSSSGVYVTFEEGYTKVIHIGDYFSRPSEDDENKVSKMTFEWLCELSDRESRRQELLYEEKNS